MTNNEILRRIRYTFDIGDDKLIDIFALTDHVIAAEEISTWTKMETDYAYAECADVKMAIFLNGLIIDRRGKKDGPQPKPEQVINNNIIFRKLKIALNLQADDVLAIMELANVRISKHELSAFFRNTGHKHYRECNNQILHNFLNGMQNRFRPNASSEW